jgi:hypothetical protein
MKEDIVHNAEDWQPDKRNKAKSIRSVRVSPTPAITRKARGAICQARVIERKGARPIRKIAGNWNSRRHRGFIAAAYLQPRAAGRLRHRPPGHRGALK